MQFSVPTDRAERSPKEVRINGKYSIYSDYKNQKIPAIFILEDQKWKISLGYYIFYYLWKTIENSDRIPI
ncbi:MAG: hypothetical protein A3G93_07970 [Nitrospinae bacterium RIFCSPLOWO2_12_FULL_45_22]|nr:MAG: hypothetical protein A3G93_07970 [Nitrospinae bacterium RIFCSPLOWO2_12_FULL_45_22]